ncbi:MAG TPA: DUF3105 domain-containing protein [Methylomirabilota bacterium]|nr:DUF3105 domain-containing protein [Methylomirabilota bacterium]
MERRRRTPLAPVLCALTVLIAAHAWVTHAENAGVGRKMPDEGQQHIPVGTRAEYGHSPPTSGPHWPQWARWGIYDRELPPELWVHNLEHGGIVILYRCEPSCKELVQQLADAYGSVPKSKHGHVKLVITPHQKLNTRLAILAWTWIDELAEFDRDRLLRFYQAHIDQGPEDVP